MIFFREDALRNTIQEFLTAYREAARVRFLDITRLSFWIQRHITFPGLEFSILPQESRYGCWRGHDRQGDGCVLYRALGLSTSKPAKEPKSAIWDHLDSCRRPYGKPC